MKPEEYSNLSRVEKEHWYYSGKRDIAETWLRRLGLDKQAGQSLVDCGAGTGAFALQMSGSCDVTAIDDYPESLAILSTRLPTGKALKGSCTELPLETASCDYVTALDVLEHIENDQTAFREMWRILKPGGGMVITVPALMSLWSEWDTSLLHFRRYDRMGLLNLVGKVSPEILVCNYMNFFAFPAIWTLRRLPRGHILSSKSRAEDVVPPAIINSLLKKIFVWSSCQNAVNWPFGVGLLCVLRKPKRTE